MKIGILLCDNVRSSLRNEFGEYPEKFIDNLTQVSSTLEFENYYCYDNEFPAEVDECDAYIITGSRQAAYDDIPWIIALKHFIVKLHRAKKKTVGICFGHQIIAAALCGKVERADFGWTVGVHAMTICENRAFMNPQKSKVNLVMLSEDQIQSLPKGENITCLATSKNCEYAMLQYDEHFLTLQGHPEFDREFAAALIACRQDLIPKNRYEEGLESLSKDDDNLLVFRWMLGFMLENNKVKSSQEEDILSLAKS